MLILLCGTTICMESVDQEMYGATEDNVFPVQELPQELQRVVLGYVGAGYPSFRNDEIFKKRKFVLKSPLIDMERTKKKETSISIPTLARTVSLSFDNNQRRVAFVHNEGEVGVYNLASDEKQFINLNTVCRYRSSNPLSTLSMSDESKIFGCYDDGLVICCDIKSEQNNLEFRRSKNRCRRILLHPTNNSECFMAFDDGKIRVWDLNANKCTHSLNHTPCKRVFDFVFHPDNPNKIISCVGGKSRGSGRLYFWNNFKREFVKNLKHNVPTSIDCNARGEIIFGDKNENLVLYNPEKERSAACAKSDDIERYLKQVCNLEGVVTNVRYMGNDYAWSTSLKHSLKGCLLYGSLCLWNLKNKCNLVVKIPSVESFEYNRPNNALFFLKRLRNGDKEFVDYSSAASGKVLADRFFHQCPVRDSVICEKKKYKTDYLFYIFLFSKINEYLCEKTFKALKFSRKEQAYFDAIPDEIQRALIMVIQNKLKKKIGRGSAILSQIKTYL